MAEQVSKKPVGDSVVNRLIARTLAIHRFALPAVYNLELPMPEYPPEGFGYDSDLLRFDVPTIKSGVTLESPFYCLDFKYIRDSPLCKSRTLQLLIDLSKYFDLLEVERGLHLQRTNPSLTLQNRLSQRERILAYPQADPDKDKDPIHQGPVYESVRLTGLALIHLSDTCLPILAAFKQRSPPPAAQPVLSTHATTSSAKVISTGPAQGTRLITNPPPHAIAPALALSLRKGPNPVSGWGVAFDGLLYWITTVGAAISRGRSEYGLISSLNAKTIFNMTMADDGRTWDEAFVPLKRFIEFQKMCLHEEITRLVDMQDYAC
jgi:hypothetical protein